LYLGFHVLGGMVGALAVLTFTCYEISAAKLFGIFILYSESNNRLEKNDVWFFECL
jgi:hypothetical protein